MPYCPSLSCYAICRTALAYHAMRYASTVLPHYRAGIAYGAMRPHSDWCPTPCTVLPYRAMPRDVRPYRIALGHASPASAYRKLLP
eukprot:75811-Rhodomonas_salina.1